MRPSRLIAPLAALLLSAAACASRPTTGATVRSGSTDFITQAEIEATPASNAYDLVVRLRPRWLQQGQRTGSISGGTIATQAVLVYLDGSRIGTIEALRSISVGDFKSLQWYDAIRASTVLRDVPREPIAGAIVISTRSGSR